MLEDSNLAAEAARIDAELRVAARPDSRFHLDTSRFIPGFAGSDRAAERLFGLTSFMHADLLFCTLEDGLREVRAGALSRGKYLIVPTYGLARGLYLLSAEIPATQHDFAATLDGMEVFGVPLADNFRADRAVPLFICGSSAITATGRRFGMGAPYIDVEWWMGRALGLVDDLTQVAAIVHDCQISPVSMTPDNTLAADFIVTPRGMIHITGQSKPTAPPSLDFAPELARLPWVTSAIPVQAKP
jgi:5-formyltetrahydrofolate cyclo-ligase